MKKNIIIAAIAAISAILLCASCQKQELIEQNNGINASGKTFTATIEQSLTKTTITNEYKVNWVEGDQIDINGSIFSATPDASDATKASLTKVSGSDPTPDYTAVYPASIMVSTQPTLPATQTYAEGRFNAPMCAMSSTETLEFKNFCGVLCFALKGTDKVKSIAVTANEQLCGPFEFADATSISFTGENEGYTVTLDCGEGVQLSSTDSTNFYVYLPPKDSYTAGMKIVVTSTEGKTFEKTTTTAVKIERNNLYTFDWTASFSPAEPEYVEIGGLKWATMNLGATTVAGSGETCYGDYYAWGEKAPYYEGTGGWPATPTWETGKTDGYAWQSYCGSSSFSEWSTPPYDATTKILKPDFDAAAQILGNGWRMPTTEEFKALYDACLNGSYDTTTNPSGASASVGKGVYWCTSYDGVAGCLFCDGTNKLFFPAVGYGGGTSLGYAGSSGGYWSSSLYSDNTGQAYISYFSSYYVYPQFSFHRCTGFSVRPVKAAAPAPTPTTTGTAKRTGDIDVNWVQLWEGGPKFAECNIGASSATDYGHYLAWGGSSDKDATYNAGSADLSGSDDSAYKVWGEHWRMPTSAELQALLSSCDVEWMDGSTKKYNNTTVKGLLCTGKGAYASNSIFLPAAGFSNGIVSYQGSIGYYWSSTPCGSDDAYSLGINSSGQLVDYCSRDNGLSVRPIYVEDLVAVTGVSLNKTELKVGVGDTETLSATVAPANATNKKVLWTSSDKKVATVDAYGKVTGVKTGECVITATTEDGGKTATCIVKVVVPTTGTAKRTGDIDVNWVQLWENGPKFAEYNVGVTDGKAESYGGYYCWGKATDKDPQAAYKGGTSALTGKDDTATNLWGDNWRMPTQTELQGLIDNCDVAWTTVGGKNGCKFTGRGAYSSNSVFLPAAGKCTRGALDTPGYEGNYYSSTPDASNSEKAYHLSFFQKSQGGVSQGVYTFKRLYGDSVRAVLAK